MRPHPPEVDLWTNFDQPLDPLTAEVFYLDHLTNVLTPVAGGSTGSMGVTPPWCLTILVQYLLGVWFGSGAMFVFLALVILYPNDRLSGFVMAMKTCRAAKLYQRPLNSMRSLSVLK